MSIVFFSFASWFFLCEQCAVVASKFAVRFCRQTDDINVRRSFFRSFRIRLCEINARVEWNDKHFSFFLLLVYDLLLLRVILLTLSSYVFFVSLNILIGPTIFLPVFYRLSDLIMCRFKASTILGPPLNFLR